MHIPAKCPPELHRCLRVEGKPCLFPPGSPRPLVMQASYCRVEEDFGRVMRRLGSLAPIGVLRWPILIVLLLVECVLLWPNTEIPGAVGGSWKREGMSIAHTHQGLPYRYGIGTGSRTFEVWFRFPYHSRTYDFFLSRTINMSLSKIKLGEVLVF